MPLGLEEFLYSDFRYGCTRIITVMGRSHGVGVQQWGSVRAKEKDCRDADCKA
jgi:hypothetical protein